MAKLFFPVVALASALLFGAFTAHGALDHVNQAPANVPMTSPAVNDTATVKLITALRRKPNLTRKEFLDYHFQKHGSLSDVGEAAFKPRKYRQYHIFDSAFGERVDGQGPPNKNHPWFWRDDVTELYFDDLAHLLRVFGSDYVKNTVGPDGNNFNDFETAIPWYGTERTVPLNTVAAKTSPLRSDLAENGHHVALYFVSTNGNTTDDLVTVFRQLIETHAPNDARALVASTQSITSEFSPTDYFGGANMPRYATIFKVVLKGPGSIAAVRKAQKAFQAQLPVVNTSDSFIVFAKEGLVLDTARGIPFNAARQPCMDDLH